MKDTCDRCGEKLSYIEKKTSRWCSECLSYLVLDKNVLRDICIIDHNKLQWLLDNVDYPHSITTVEQMKEFDNTLREIKDEFDIEQ